MFIFYGHCCFSRSMPPSTTQFLAPHFQQFVSCQGNPNICCIIPSLALPSTFLLADAPSGIEPSYRGQQSLLFSVNRIVKSSYLHLSEDWIDLFSLQRAYLTKLSLPRIFAFGGHIYAKLGSIMNRSLVQLPFLLDDLAINRSTLT